MNRIEVQARTVEVVGPQDLCNIAFCGNVVRAGLNDQSAGERRLLSDIEHIYIQGYI